MNNFEKLGRATALRSMFYESRQAETSEAEMARLTRAIHELTQHVSTALTACVMELSEYIRQQQEINSETDNNNIG